MLILTWSGNCVASDTAGKTTFPMTDTKLYVLVVTVSIQDNLVLLKSGFGQTINWNKY